MEEIAETKMPLYEFDCPECGRFEKLYKKATGAKSCKCECGVKATRAVSTVAEAQFVGAGFHTNTIKQRKRKKDKGLVKEFYNNETRLAKKRTATMGKAYKPMDFIPGEKSKHLTKEEFDKRNVKRKELTIDAHKRAGLDPTEKRHEQ